MLKKLLWFMPTWLQGLIYYSISGILFIGSGVAATLYLFQNRMLYHPEIPRIPRDPAGNPARYRHPGESYYDMPYDDEEVVAEDGVKLHCWFIRQPKPQDCATIIFFQENAGNMGLRLPSMAALYRNLGVNIFMVSYRGYGRSEGTPDEVGIKMDAKAVMEHVFKKKEVDRRRILILGRSLGGAVGTYIASAFPQYVRGLILENTFTSIPDMVDAIFPKWISTMKWLVLRISWGSIDLIPSVTSPILFISGLKDELVPPEHMRKMHDAAVKSIYKEWHPVPDGTHNDTSMVDPTYVATIKAFMDKIGCYSTAPRGKVDAADGECMAE